MSFANNGQLTESLRGPLEPALEAAEIAYSDDDQWSATVSGGVAVLAGIAAADAICCASLNERSASPDHQAAITLLGRVRVPDVDDLVKALSFRISIKNAAHYSSSLLSIDKSKRGLRAADLFRSRAGPIVNPSRR